MDTATITLFGSVFGAQIILGVVAVSYILRRVDKLNDRIDKLNDRIDKLADRMTNAENRAQQRHDAVLALIYDLRKDDRGLDSRISRIEGRLDIRPITAEVKPSSNDTEPTPAPTATDVEQPPAAPTTAPTPVATNQEGC